MGRPRLDPALWSWFWQFARHCNERQMLAAGRAIQGLLATSRTMYEELLAREQIQRVPVVLRIMVLRDAVHGTIGFRLSAVPLMPAAEAGPPVGQTPPAP